MKASTYACLVVVDIAVVERDCAAANADAASTLPNKEGARFGQFQKVYPSRRWGGSMLQEVVNLHAASTQGSHT